MVLRRICYSLVLLGIFGVTCTATAWAQVGSGNPGFSKLDLSNAETMLDNTATDAAQASDSGNLATQSANLVRRITDKSSDLTENQGEAKGKLEKLVLDNPITSLNLSNFLRFGIHGAVTNNVPANTIVLVLMFPIITALIAASRHLLGLRGFGIFTPALVSVGFLATGLVVGFTLFFIIFVAATVGRMVIRKLKLAYMPRTSLLLWLVSVVVLSLLLISPLIGMNSLAQLSIFPILLMVLLAETFIDVQAKRSRSEAVEMTLETLLLAVLSYFLMNLEVVQQWVLLNPELVMISVVIMNIFIGKFTGLRLMEYIRFKRIID